MRLSKRRRTGTAAVNMTPMIDIVFLLIIFFMTVSQVTQINREQLNLPKQKGGADQEPSIVTLNVTEKGDVLVSGNKVSSVARLARVLKDQITDELGGDPNRMTIVIRADQRGTTAKVNEIVSALALLQLKRVRIAVEVPDP